MRDLAGPVRDMTADEAREAGLRPTGSQIFAALSPDEQDAILGPAAAEKVRQGEATLADFVQREGDFITQKPVEEL